MKLDGGAYRCSYSLNGHTCQLLSGHAGEHYNGWGQWIDGPILPRCEAMRPLPAYGEMRCELPIGHEGKHKGGTGYKPAEWNDPVPPAPPAPVVPDVPIDRNTRAIELED